MKDVLRDWQEKANSAKDTRNSIVTAYNTTEIIENKVKQMDKQTMKDIMNAETKDIHINLSEVDTLVFRPQNTQDKENNR